MNEKEETFKARFLNGECPYEEIDEYVERWHNGEGQGKSLREYLGMDLEEYEYMLKHAGEETAHFLKRQCNLRNA